MYPPRQGPRPLPLHLLIQAGTLLASLTALPNLKNGSLNLKNSAGKGAPDTLRLALENDVSRLSPEGWGQFSQAVTAEALHRHRRFVDGVAAYRRHPARRRMADYPVIWQQGTTRLLDCRGPGQSGPPVLLIPSLINRSYILDLTPRNSVVRGLGRRQVSVFMLDWDRSSFAE